MRADLSVKLFEAGTITLLQVTGGWQAGDLFELMRKVCDTAVPEGIGDFCKVKFSVRQHFLGLYYFIDDYELPYGNAFYFWKDIGQVGIIII